MCFFHARPTWAEFTRAIANCTNCVLDAQDVKNVMAEALAKAGGGQVTPLPSGDGGADETPAKEAAPQTQGAREEAAEWKHDWENNNT